MGLFDFLKKDKKEQESVVEKKQTQVTNQAASDEEAEVVYELRLKASSMGVEQEAIQRAVKMMVAEDPFKNFYNGKDESDFLYIPRKIYKYEAITTMNIQLVPEKQDLWLVVENQKLGKLSTVDKQKIENYVGQYLLTGYAYIQGGEGKHYSPDIKEVLTDIEDYDLELTLQFS